MPAALPVPSQLTRGPFTREAARAAGLTDRMLQSRRFTRLFPRVFVWIEHEMTLEDWIHAARLALPDDARVSHLTRLQRLGLTYGSPFPLHLTMKGELHRNIEGIMLHRTIALPPDDGQNVCVEAAYIGFAADARTIDLIKVGDWLLHHGYLDKGRLCELATLEPWRPGAAEVLSIVADLDGRSASLTEPELRAIFVAAGLPIPEPNRDIYHGDVLVARVDLLFVVWRLIVEYEGRHHLYDVGQWNRDIGRYEALRDLGYPYLQVTNEMRKQPRALVLRVHRKLVELGYDGPRPHFGARWRRLFGRPCAPARFAG